jgi:hypothetical protein
MSRPIEATPFEELPAGVQKAIKRDRAIRRLRDRAKQAAAANPDDPMPGIVQGVLDLLEDL